MPVTRFEMENQAIQRQIAEALGSIAKSLEAIAARKQSAARTARSPGRTRPDDKQT